MDAPLDCDGIRSLTRGQSGALPPVLHRIEVDDSDLNIPEARFFHYVQYVVRGEAEDRRKNNCGHRQFIPTFDGHPV